MIEPGHNVNGQLKSIVERIENLDMQIAELRSDQKDIFSEAKSEAWDVKALRTILRLRKLSPDDRAAQEAILDTYKHALGME